MTSEAGIQGTEASYWRRFWDERSHIPNEDQALSSQTLRLGPKCRSSLEDAIHGFLDFRPDDTVLDAGCGTGYYIKRYASEVAHATGFDVSEGMVERARRALEEDGVRNADLFVGDLRDMSGIASDSRTKVLCRSVLHYLNDQDVTICLKEFQRIAADGGSVVLHVKNASSPFGVSLALGRWVRAAFLGRKPFYEAYRPAGWYLSAMADAGIEDVAYFSFGLYPMVFPPFLKRLVMRAESALLDAGWKHSLGVELWLRGRVRKA